MFIEYFKAWLLIFFFSCSSKLQESQKGINVEKAKWYYYSYATIENAYTNTAQSYSPLECDIKQVDIKKINDDTTKFFFRLYKDSIDITLKPRDLTGIMIIRDSFYLPVYGHTIYEPFKNDAEMVAYMNKWSKLLKEKLEKENLNLSQWLKDNRDFYQNNAY